ncbi:MAG TPA: PAS domain S-box protein [Methanoregulaceae archaeon]|nr:PAS domain S-box protein [Methanoregulaceae archaeon]
MISVLLVDDDPSLLEITGIYLKKNKNISVDTSSSAREALEKMKDRSYDVIVSDYDMPEMNGIEFLKILRSSGDQTPFILFTGKGQEQVASDAINNGASFYLIRAGDPKSEFLSLSHKIKRAVEQRRAEIELKNSEERLRLILDSLPSGVMIIDAETHNVIGINPAALRMMGHTEKEIIGKPCFRVICPNEEGACPITDLDETMDSIERTLVTKNGMKKPVIKSVARITLNERPVLVESFIDLTEQKKIEKALHESREKYRMLVEEIHDMIWLVDAKGKFKYVSPRSVSLLGLRPEEMIGHTPSEFISFEDGKKVRDIFEESLVDHREIHLVETHMHHKDGRTLVIESSAVPYFSKDGKLLGFRGVSRDITAIKKGEEVIALLAAIVTSSDDAIISEGLNHTITTWNKGAERIFGYFADEIIGTPALRLVPDNGVQALDEVMERVMKGEYQQHFDAFRLKKDGSEVEVSLSLSPIRDSQNEIVGIATIARDLTRQRETEKALISYIAETAMRLKNPVEMIADRLSDVRDQIGAGDVSEEEIRLQLQTQIRNAEQIVANLRDLNQAIMEGFSSIPDAYRKYLIR